MLSKINSKLESLYEKLIKEITKSHVMLRDFAIFTTYKRIYPGQNIIVPVPANKILLKVAKEHLKDIQMGFRDLYCYKVEPTSMSNITPDTPPIPSPPRVLYVPTYGFYKNNFPYSIELEEKSLIAFNPNVVAVLKIAKETKQDSIILKHRYITDGKIVFVDVSQTYSKFKKEIENTDYKDALKIPFSVLEIYQAEIDFMKIIKRSIVEVPGLEVSKTKIGTFKDIVKEILETLVIPSYQAGIPFLTYFSCVKGEFCFWFIT